VQTAKMAQNENLIKKLSQWDKVSRKDWKWEQTPTYRQKISNVMKTNDLVASHMRSDMRSLDGLEEGLEAMKHFLTAASSAPSLSTRDHIRESDSEEVISLQDCLSLKHQTQEKIKKTMIQQRRESTSSIPEVKITEAPPQQSKPAILAEDHTDLPPRGARRDRDDVGLTFLTDVAIEEKLPGTPKQPSIQKTPSVPLERSLPSAAIVDPRPPSRSRNLHSVESLLKFFPPKEDVNLRRKSVVGSLLLQKPLVRPSSGTAAAVAAAAAIEGTNLIERQTEWIERLESKRRVAKLAQEKELVKEVSHLLHFARSSSFSSHPSALSSQLRATPNISIAQQSWEKAKRSHSKEMSRENTNEMMKRQLEEMKEQIRSLRSEEKNLKWKCSVSSAKLLENERKLQEGSGVSSEKRPKGKKKRRPRRGRSEEDEEGKTSDQESHPVKLHHAHVMNTPVLRQDPSSSSLSSSTRRPASANGSSRRPPSASSSRSSLNSTSSSTLFPELHSASSSSLVDVLDLVLSPSPHYSSMKDYISPGGMSSGKSLTSSQRREAFQVSDLIRPSSALIAATTRESNHFRPYENESISVASSSSSASSGLFLQATLPSTLHQQRPTSSCGSSSAHDTDSYDDSTMISNITERSDSPSLFSLSLHTYSLFFPPVDPPGDPPPLSTLSPYPRLPSPPRLIRRIVSLIPRLPQLTRDGIVSMMLETLTSTVCSGRLIS
jgi:hypothetical protein